MAARPNSPFYLRETTPRRYKGTGKSKEIDAIGISVQTETWEMRSSEGSIYGWNGEEKGPKTPPVSLQKQQIRPKKQVKTSDFERYLKGQCLRKDLTKSRITIKKRLAP